MPFLRYDDGGRGDTSELRNPLLEKKADDINTRQKSDDTEPKFGISLLDANLIFSCVGNAFEWYDFAVFGFIAPELSEEIFPSSDSSTALIEAFSVYAVAFLCRPISGVILGWLGDKWGRKKTITIALAMMGIATLIAGATPSYRSIGIGSAVLLCISRMMQGLSVGAQSTGSFLLVLEKSPYNHHGFLTAILISSQLSGFILGGLVPALMRLIWSPQWMSSWGWRVALWIGLIPCAITFITHKGVTDEYKKAQEIQIEESEHDDIEGREEDFSHLNPKPNPSRSPALRLDFIGIFLGTCTYIGGALVFYLSMVWVPVFLHQTAGPIAGIAGTCAVSFFALLCIPIAGYFIDQVDPYRYAGMARFGNSLLALPFLVWIIRNPSLTRYAIMMGVMLPVLSVDFVSTCKILVPYFAAEGRYISLAIAHNAGVGFTGGTAPMIAQYLITQPNGEIHLGLYVSCALVVASLGIFALRIRPRNFIKGGPANDGCVDVVAVKSH